MVMQARVTMKEAYFFSASRPRSGLCGRSGLTVSVVRLLVRSSLSKFTLIDPTLVAPTGVYEKKPQRHRPKRTTLSFSVNNPGKFRCNLTETKLSTAYVLPLHMYGYDK